MTRFRVIPALFAALAALLIGSMNASEAIAVPSHKAAPASSEKPVEAGQSCKTIADKSGKEVYKEYGLVLKRWFYNGGASVCWTVKREDKQVSDWQFYVEWRPYSGGLIKKDYDVADRKKVGGRIADVTATSVDVFVLSQVTPGAMDTIRVSLTAP